MEIYNILVVDDDREIVRSLSRLLELEGYRVYKAYHGVEALDILMSEQIPLLVPAVLTACLFRLTGLLKIRVKNNNPVIMLSAKTE